MPANNAPWGWQNASVRINGNYLLMMATMAIMSFGASIIERPVDELTRRAACKKHHGYIVSGNNQLCHTGDVQTLYEQYNYVSQVLQAFSGLLCAYVLCRLSDFNGRRFPVFIGTVLWSLGIIIGCQKFDHTMKAYWTVCLFISAGRILVEGTIFAMVTDISNDATRSTNHANMICSALGGHLAGQILSKPVSDASFIVPIVVSSGSALLSSCFLCVCGTDTRRRQQENYQNDPAAADSSAGAQNLQPSYQVLKAILRSSFFLLVIIAGAPSLASTSVAWLEVYFPARFGTTVYFPGNGSIRFWHYCVAILSMGAVNYFISHVLAQNPQRTPLRRDHCVLLAAAFFPVLGAVLLVQNNGSAVALGVFVATLGSGVFSVAPSLLLSLLGRRVRSKFAGRVFGVLYTLQSFATVVVTSVMYLSALSSGHKKQGPLWAAFAGCWVICVAAWRVGRAVKAADRESAPPYEEVVLQDLNGDAPRAPPPAYVEPQHT